MKNRYLRLLLVLLCSGCLFASSAQKPIVVCVGNSITFGATLKSAATQAYPALLQAKLGSGYDVRNFGISGRTMLKKGNFPYWNETKFADIFTVKPTIIRR